jgi:hypothetical protein
MKGLHDHGAEPTGGAKKFSPLDALQAAYRKGIRLFMAKPALAVGLGVIGTVAGAWAFRYVPQQFFPNAERNQFVVDVWMPQGSRIEATDTVVKRIEHELRSDKTVGQSSPRFYYNVNPQQPDSAYAQFIVNTTSVKATTALVADLQTRLMRLAPEAMVLVQELQQGATMEAPIEIRVSGDDITQLKAIGGQVGDLLRADSRARFVHTDYRNDSPMADININAELANRLGMTHQHLLGGGPGRRHRASARSRASVQLRPCPRHLRGLHGRGRPCPAPRHRQYGACLADQPHRPSQRRPDPHRARLSRTRRLWLGDPQGRPAQDPGAALAAGLPVRAGRGTCQ